MTLDEGVFVLASIVDISVVLERAALSLLSYGNERSDVVLFTVGAAGRAAAEWMAFTGQTAEEMLGDGWANALHSLRGKVMLDYVPTGVSWSLVCPP